MKLLFPLKVAGSKARLIPHVLDFLGGPSWPVTLVEPFAGSAVVGLTLLRDGYCQRLVIAEKDVDYRAFWRTALGDSDFGHRVSGWTKRAYALPFDERRPFVLASLEKMKRNDPGFRMLLRSRIQFAARKNAGVITDKHPGGILRFCRHGMHHSLNVLYGLRSRITVLEDGFEALAATNREDSFAFVDPPYTMTPTCPGHDIYDETEVDHAKLLSLLEMWKGRWMLTYNLCPATRQATLNLPCTKSYFSPVTCAGANGGATSKWELLVTRDKPRDGAVPR